MNGLPQYQLDMQMDFCGSLHKQSVLVKGKRVPIVGKICMDQCMIRFEENVPIGEKVRSDREARNGRNPIEEWAETLETIPYEICCTVL